MKNFTKKALLLILAALIALSLTSVYADTLQIGIPDDARNLPRGIKLLETAGFIKVNPEAGYAPELADITEYLYNIEIVPLAANTLPSVLEDFAGAAINGTYATSAGLVPSRDGLIIEKQSEGGDNPYINIIASRTADKDNEIFQKIVEVYQTQLVAEYMLIRYEESFFPAFEYDSNLTLTQEEVDEITAYRSNPEGKTTVSVGVCGSQNDYWYAVQKLLDEQNANIYIKLVEFEGGYTLPNDALNAGEIDLNAFQHKNYLNGECEKFGYDIVAIGDTLIAPLTLYSKNFESIDAIKEAAGAK